MNISKERREGIEYHVEAGDYFGTMATILYLIRQNERDGEIVEVLDRLTGDLLYLQEEYRIDKK